MIQRPTMSRGRSGGRRARGAVVLALVAVWTVLAVAPLEGQQGDRRGWLGVQVELADGRDPVGLTIRAILPGGPGDRAELRPGDVILRIEGVPATRESLEASLARIRPGDRLGLVVRRGLVDREIAVIAAPRPHIPQGRGEGVRARMRWGDRPAAVVGLRAVAGAEFRNLDPGLARYFGVEGGLLVLEVAEGTPARAAGLEPGDVVKTVQDTPVRTVADLRRIVAQRGSGDLRASDPIILQVVRNGEGQTVELRMVRMEPR